MSATPLAVTPITRAGVVDALTAANADGHTIVNTTQKMWVEVLNSSVASITVTFDIPVLVDGQLVTDRAVVIAAGVRKKIGIFPTQYYSESLTMTFSAVVTVTVAAWSI